MFKKLLTLTTVLEGSTGLIIIIAPEPVVSMLLGAELNESTGIFMSRLTGVSLVTLSIFCWSQRNGQRDDAIGRTKALLFYNIAAAVLLIVAWISGFRGLGIWPASLLHAGMALWCIKVLIR